jgi:hypothetical protein
MPLGLHGAFQPVEPVTTPRIGRDKGEIPGALGRISRPPDTRQVRGTHARDGRVLCR